MGMDMMMKNEEKDREGGKRHCSRPPPSGSFYGRLSSWYGICRPDAKDPNYSIIIWYELG